ncbi:hypothetical protein ACFC6L_26665 [Kitasatospora phosalacinea]
MEGEQVVAGAGAEQRVVGGAARREWYRGTTRGRMIVPGCRRPGPERA